MNLEKFLDKRLKIERIEESKEDNKRRLIITLPNEIVDMINSNTECKKILKDNIVKFIRELKKELEIERDIVSIDTIRYI